MSIRGTPRVQSWFLCDATWLQEIQLIQVDEIRRVRGRSSAETFRLRGVAPHNDLRITTTWFSAELEGGYVWLGTASGTRWTLVPFLRPTVRSLAVLDGIDRDGRLILVDPQADRESG